VPRKKIAPPIKGFGKDPETKLTVQKSIPLFALWRSGLTLAEFKILDTYLSRIDSHKPEKRAVVFTKDELENLLGLKQIKPEVLDERLKHLMETTVELSPKVSKRIDRITLFERSQAEQDDFGQWTAQLTCTPSAMKYVFNIDEIGYLRYKLRCVTSIKSLYSYILFTYLERNRFRKEWEVPLGELKELLNCDGEETYKAYKRFNDLILKKCHKELNEKTECRFTYTPIRKGRSVAAIRFEVETLPAIEIPEVEPNQITLFEGKSRDAICHGFSSSEFDDFTNDQLELLKELGWEKKSDDAVMRHNDVLGDMKLACEYAVSDYLRKQIILAKMKKPKNIFLYVKKMIEND